MKDGSVWKKTLEMRSTHVRRVAMIWKEEVESGVVDGGGGREWGRETICASGRTHSGGTAMGGGEERRRFVRCVSDCDISVVSESLERRDDDAARMSSQRELKVVE